MKYRIIVLMLAASAICGCGKSGVSGQAASGPNFTSDENGITVLQESPLAAKLKLAEVAPQTMELSFKTTASVSPRSGGVAEIGLPFGGRVVRSFVRLGQETYSMTER